MSGRRRAALLVVGCLILGFGVALLLVADLGSDGFSTLVNGLAIATGLPFFVANTIVSGGFLVLAALRRVLPGIGTLVQIVLVGATVSVIFEYMGTPSSLAARVGLVLVAMPVLAVGIAMYLGANLGAGPIEAAALAWDPPVPFKWSYSAVQLLGAAVGWLLGGTIGLTTVVVIASLGPLVDLTSRLLRLDVHQGPAHHEPVPER
ncbi:hypothetical protein GA707_05020 [Nostocoides sp. F2B08]|uniref:YczE/YyaS/YitT family protein n=1 Tax=Nostocoides sp. F2B08 TaxID=2653936 RepID=UPI001263D1D0|nr:hypothetical protein [Tetrasphaera sp. F2B08]KAB7745302.1 hypothetical protein GA707_05020 [Tetrasphaera sp. F2B08]